MNKFYSIVEIFWKDHYSLPDGWYDDPAESGVRIISTTGYLVKEDDSYYYVSTSFDWENETFSSGVAILKNCILKQRVVSKGEINYDQFSKKRITNKNSKLRN